MREKILPILPSAILILIERGLDFAGWTSMVMSTLMWLIAACLAYWGYIHPSLNTKYANYILTGVLVLSLAIFIMIVTHQKSRVPKANLNETTIEEIKASKNIDGDNWLRQEFDLQREQGVKVQVGSKSSQIEFELLRRLSKNSVEVQEFSVYGITAKASKVHFIWGGVNSKILKLFSKKSGLLIGEIELRPEALVEICSSKWDMRITILSVDVQKLRILLEKKPGTYHPKAIFSQQFGCKFMKSPWLSGGFATIPSKKVGK